MREEEYVLFKCEPLWDYDTIAVCPYGKWGKIVEKILKKHGKKVICFDNYVRGCKKIYKIEEYRDIGIMFCCDNDSIYNELFLEVQKKSAEIRVVELFPRFICGRYSYGPITENVGTVEKIGAFCSFAKNTEVVENHDVYISSHEFLSFSGDWESHPGFIPGLTIRHPRFTKKSIIGNDVWIGKNSTIIAGCNIGNGVIVGANTVVTHDIPDYAVVVGTPGRIIKYRYTSDQIEELNRIAWWNWSDKEIIDNIDSFYLDINEFIEIHKGKG